MASGKEKSNKIKKVIFLIPGVIFLLVFPLIIFRPVKNNEVPAKNQERFTFMSNTPRLESDRHDLTYWEKVGNPQLFAKPDSEFGYSAFLVSEIKDIKPASSSNHKLPELPIVFSAGEVKLHQERTPESLLSPERFSLVERAKEYKIPFIKNPAVILEDGSVFPVSGFKQPDSKVKNLNPTLLLVEQRKTNMPPVITVLRSCGDSELDRAAMRAILVPAAVNRKISGKVRIEWQQNGGKK